jgi:type II secretion system protein G
VLPAPGAGLSSRHSPLGCLRAISPSLGSCHCARAAGAAFTLIELLVVIAIIAILAGLTLSTLGYVNRKGAESRAKAEVAALSAAIDSYRLDFGRYPSVVVITNPVELYRELVGKGTINTNKVYFEPTPNITTNLTNGPFMDPWGAAYRYSTNSSINNVGFFDLWTSNNAPTKPELWIRN